MCFPIWYSDHKKDFSVFQQLNYYLTLCGCCSCILFAVIWHKRVKHRMEFENVRGLWWCSLVWITELFQLNYFNIQRSITTIVLILNLVLKNSYYKFWIISMEQHIVVNCTAFECLLARISTLMYFKNMYVWKVLCKFLHGWYL